MSVFEKGMG